MQLYTLDTLILKHCNATKDAYLVLFTLHQKTASPLKLALVQAAYLFYYSCVNVTCILHSSWSIPLTRNSRMHARPRRAVVNFISARSYEEDDIVRTVNSAGPNVDYSTSPACSVSWYFVDGDPLRTVR